MTRPRGVRQAAVDLKQRTVPTTQYTNNCSTTLRPGEVVLIRIDYHQTPGGKIRPAVVLLDAGDEDCVAAPITSHLARSDFDFAIRHWRAHGCYVVSYDRVRTVTLLAHGDIDRP